jgi:hypothetical protein
MLARRLLLPLSLLTAAATFVACGSSDEDAPADPPCGSGERCAAGAAGSSGGAAGSWAAGGNAGGGAPDSSWARAIEGTGDRYLVGLAPAPGGGAVAVGFFDGTVDLGGGPLSNQGSFASSEPQWAIFVSKVDEKGAHVWSKRFGGPGVAKPQAVAVDAKGNVFLAGGFTDTLSFGDVTLTASGGTDVFLAALDETGQTRWASRFGNGADQIANAVGVDARGDVTIAGVLAGAIDFGGGSLESKGDDDIFLAKFKGDGTPVFAKRFGEGGSQRAFALAVDIGGNLLVSVSNAGSRDLFVAKFDVDGAHVFSRSFGAASDQIGRAIATSSTGRIAVAGEFAGDLDFGPPIGDATAKVAPLTVAAGGAAGSAGAAGSSGSAGSAGSEAGGAAGTSAAGGSDAAGAAGAGGSAPAVDPLAGDCVGKDVYYSPTSAHCYAYTAEPKTWDDALATCKARGKGWSLLTVNSLGEVASLQEKLGATAGWAGGTDAAKEGTFVWASGEPYDVPASFWNEGEPNDSGGAEDCMQFVASGKLNDAGCSTELASICERGSPYPLTSKGGTDGFVVVFDPLGAKLWDKPLGDADDQRVWAVAFDAAGGVVIGGDAPGTLDLGSGELPAGHAFIAAFGEKGAPSWNNRFGPGIGQMLGVTVSGGRTFAGGAFTGNLQVGGATMAAGDHVGAFLVGR